MLSFSNVYFSLFRVYLNHMLTHLTVEVQMLTQVLPVLQINHWVELPGTSQGVIIQRLSGAKLYYRYADTRPHDDVYLGL